MSCMSNISIVGVVGSLSFEGDADPISNVQIERIQGSDRITNYHRMSNCGHSGTIISFQRTFQYVYSKRNGQQYLLHHFRVVNCASYVNEDSIRKFFSLSNIQCFFLHDHKF